MPTPEPLSDASWLQAYIESAVDRQLCTKIYCTTCGAREFRVGLLEAFARHSGRADALQLDRESASAIGCELASVRPISARMGIEDPVRMILFEVWSVLGGTVAETLVAPYLTGTWSGEVLARMQTHHRRRMEEQRAHAESQRPEIVQQRRAAKKLARQEEHHRRLERKKDRDRQWRTNHPHHGES